MTARMESNMAPFVDAEVDITVEEDDGVFLSISGRDPDSLTDVFDFVTTDPIEIEDFFDTVDRARREWERRRNA